MIDFIDKYDILHKYIFGFKKSHSTHFFIDLLHL